MDLMEVYLGGKDKQYKFVKCGVVLRARWMAKQLFGMNVISTLKVCNDSAERGVKLVADFLHLAKKEDNLKNYVQVVVQEDCRKVPNLRKRHLPSE